MMHVTNIIPSQPRLRLHHYQITNLVIRFSSHYITVQYSTVQYSTVLYPHECARCAPDVPAQPSTGSGTIVFDY